MGFAGVGGGCLSGSEAPRRSTRIRTQKLLSPSYQGLVKGRNGRYLGCAVSFSFVSVVVVPGVGFSDFVFRESGSDGRGDA